MIKTMFAFGAALLVAAPVAAQDAAAAPASSAAGAPAGDVPMCSATVHDSCNQGANNPRAMTADQAMASGGVGDRKTDQADYNAPASGAAKPAAHRRVVHHTATHRSTGGRAVDKTTTTAGSTTTTDTTTKP